MEESQAEFLSNVLKLMFLEDVDSKEEFFEKMQVIIDESGE